MSLGGDEPPFFAREGRRNSGMTAPTTTN